MDEISLTYRDITNERIIQDESQFQIMKKMYFSNLNPDSIFKDEPEYNRLRINPELYMSTVYDDEKNTRVFLDTKLLKIRNRAGISEPKVVKLVTKNNASVGLSVMEGIGPVVYVTEALMNAQFKKMSPEDFKASFLAPLDKAIKLNEITCLPLLLEYKYPLDDTQNSEFQIQTYFNEDIARPLKILYHDLCGSQSNFGSPPMFRPPLYKQMKIQPDTAHLYSYTESGDFNSPDYCFALGDYKKGNYKFCEGFARLLQVIRNYSSTNRRQLRLQLSPEKPPRLFQFRYWESEVVFALVLRKYLLDAFVSGTDRVFISDHQNFSGFFQYEFVGEQMKFNYFIINDPETVADGITLRAAIAGFFYRDLADAAAVKKKLAPYCELAKKVKGEDPFGNVTPKHRLQGASDYKKTLPDTKGNLEGKVEESIEGNTICRVIYDAPECFPSLGDHLPYKVFVKLYHFSSRSWEMHDLMCFGIPTKEQYYDMFYNELVINEKISKSKYAAHFPKLFTSGYWNGLHDQLIHVFEYLGKEVPIESWDNEKVYRIIKTRIEELHELGISHNDISESNIHVSIEGKVSLIDFGLSDCDNNDERKQKDFDDLDEIFQKGKYLSEKNTNTMDQYKENFEFYPMYEYKITNYEEKLGGKKKNRDNSKLGPVVQKNVSNFLNR